MKSMNCPLCKRHGKPFCSDEFFICDNCSGIYKSRKNYISTDAEINRYKEHKNNVNDVRYQKFVSPITDYVLKNFTLGKSGLDFGSGTAPVISKVLQDNGYVVHQFDPFFSNKTELLNGKYDYIVSCEVIEHFHNPDAEFELLHKMLNPNGALICMTHLYDKNTDFKNWYYKNDPTHVFFYHRQTIKYIADYYGFKNFKINSRLLVLTI